ncbi:MAG: 5'/3'-nucleotidase SurE [bacterium]
MRPYVLLTNDDGIAAPGIYALYCAIKEIADVVVVAPDRERSAAGHSITIANPLRVEKYEKNGDFLGHAVNGTPADCVKIAYFALLDRKPDAVISGINFGSNTGINVIYSGTVSAATEGSILNIPSFAVSLTTYEDPHFNTAANFAAKFLPAILKNKLPYGVAMNINVPNVPEEKVKGVKITRQGMALYEDRYEMRKDPRNHVYYWLTGSKVNIEDALDIDDGAIKNNYISIAPIHYDLTRYDLIEDLKKWDL